MPRRGHGQVVLSTREQVGPVAQRLRVDALGDEAAVAVLAVRSPEVPPANAVRLTHRLDGHALALEQAVAQRLADTGASVVAHLARLESAGLAAASV